MKNKTKYLVIEILNKVQLAKYVTYIMQLDYRLVADTLYVLLGC